MYLPLAAAGSHQMSTGSIENQGSDDIQSILPSRHPHPAPPAAAAAATGPDRDSTSTASNGFHTLIK